MLAWMMLTGCTTTLNGNGEIVEQAMAVTPFSSIASEGINMTVTSGDTWTVTVVGDQNIIDDVQLVQQYDHVSVYISDSTDVYPTELTVVVTAPYLEEVAHSEGADLFIDGLDQEELEIISEGIGNAEVIGMVDHLTLTVNGEGNWNGQDLSSSTISVEHTGSGNVFVTAFDAIDGALSGAGDINVYGKPTDRMVTDSGEGVVAYY